MNQTWAEVNAAVLAVLAEWARPRRGIERQPARPDVFVDRLLGVRQVERLADRDEVQILASTVITPLARDFLKQRGVAVRVVSGRDAAFARRNRQGEWGFALESIQNPGLIASLRRHWLDGSDWSEVLDPAAWVVGGDGRGALIVADEASVVTWRANQVAGIRAATVGDVESTARAVRHLGANVVVVEPTTRSIHLIGQIAQAFRMGGAPEAPDWGDL